MHRRTFFNLSAAALATASLPPLARADAADLRDDLSRLFSAAATRGTMVVHDTAKARVTVVDRARAEEGFRPASTFKIPNALLALELGIAGPDSPVFPWDGQKRWLEVWNRDQTLRSAFKVSLVPTFQEIARRIGAERMARYVEAFDYGNKNIGGAPLDRFWLEGDLRISTFQQVAFLRKLQREELPASKWAQALVKDVMLMESGEGFIIRGKTGWDSAAKPGTGWWVGWVERAAGPVFFALNLDVTDSKAHIPARLQIARAVLQELGVLPR
jgi:beta-lactamase class D